jgi:hypothetical protein
MSLKLEIFTTMCNKYNTCSESMKSLNLKVFAKKYNRLESKLRKVCLVS